MAFSNISLQMTGDDCGKDRVGPDLGHDNPV